MSCGFITRVMTKGPGRPSLAELQLAPPSALLKTPLSWVAAYNVLGFCGSITTAEIEPPSGPRLVHWWDLADSAAFTDIAHANSAAGIPRFRDGIIPRMISGCHFRTSRGWRE